AETQQKINQVDYRQQYHCVSQRGPIKLKTEGSFNARQLDKDQKHQAVQQNSKSDSSRKRDHKQVQIFKKQDKRDMFLLHSENMKKPEFLFSPFHQETVAVNQEHHGKQPDDPDAKFCHHSDILRSIHLV